MYKNKVNFDNFFEILTLLFYELENLVQESLESWKILFQRTIEVIQFSQSQFLLAHWLQNDLESSKLARNPIKKFHRTKKPKKKLRKIMPELNNLYFPFPTLDFLAEKMIRVVNSSLSNSFFTLF